MDLLCPNCVQKLTIPDEFAGQMVKCPQCGHAFSAPELPGAPGPAVVPPPPPPPRPAVTPTPVATPVPVVPTSPPASPSDGHPGAFTPAIPERPPWDSAPAAPSPPPPAPQPAHEPLAPAAAPPPPAPAAPLLPPPADYRHRGSLHVNPGLLRWVALGAVVVVFVLSFTPWVGRYPGGVPVVTQSAWQAAFGAVDDESKQFPPDVPLRAVSSGEQAPGASAWLIFYVLLLIVALLLTLAAVVWDLLPTALPPTLQRFRPWRWGLVTAVTLLTLVLLVVQEVSGFPLEARVTEEVDRQEVQKKAEAPGAAAVDVKRAAVLRGREVGELHRTASLTWATGLNALAALAALLVFWVERRGARPLPRVDALW
jgi:hypothetical protein